jgi:hypothetical protein
MTATFRISPIIRVTLTLFYLALLLPLPFLAQLTAGASPELMAIGLLLGFVALQGALAQQVLVDDQAIRTRIYGQKLVPELDRSYQSQNAYHWPRRPGVLPNRSPTAGLPAAHADRGLLEINRDHYHPHEY